MENGKESIYPSDKIVDGGHVKLKTKGLTKREYFAGLAMHGILSNATGGTLQSGNKCFSPYEISKLSIKHADELLKQLENEQQSN